MESKKSDEPKFCQKWSDYKKPTKTGKIAVGKIDKIEKRQECLPKNIPKNCQKSDKNQAS
ncbi:MAG: hypothetical protein COS68_05970 [Elusimicrobia bacterium CG06_land_8_20_14_3_00_38_11]|nr:MAG: hypothetical protein COS68_05970 [Elusimicrobia bacterium CG06_land_8_20_14_3_00_38_11]